LWQGPTVGDDDDQEANKHDEDQRQPEAMARLGLWRLSRRSDADGGGLLQGLVSLVSLVSLVPLVRLWGCSGLQGCRWCWGWGGFFGLIEDDVIFCERVFPDAAVHVPRGLVEAHDCAGSDGLLEAAEVDPVVAAVVGVVEGDLELPLVCAVARRRRHAHCGGSVVPVFPFVPVIFVLGQGLQGERVWVWWLGLTGQCLDGLVCLEGDAGSRIGGSWKRLEDADSVWFWGRLLGRTLWWALRKLFWHRGGVMLSWGGGLGRRSGDWL
jgi:hypothetical protein